MASKTNVQVMDCDTAEEFVGALAMSTSRRDAWYPYQWLYRGHASSNWDLVPTALR